jgi:hypothetical protein
MRFLTVVLVVIAGSVAPPPEPGAPCTDTMEAQGLCAEIVGDAVEIGGSATRPGAPGNSAGGGSSWSAEDQAAYEAALAALQAELDRLYQLCLDMNEDPSACVMPTIVADAAGPVEAAPSITISDLAAFRPLVGELVVEPDGWGVVGTPTNFYATAETHTMSGELFDVPIEVRWTPTSYVFDYGDGTSETSSASGVAWRGPEESWTETATSHTYASRDDVTASLSVVFTAEVDAAGGWFPVPGTLAVAAPSVPVKIFEVGTVLTEGDCMADPMAAGCG